MWRLVTLLLLLALPARAEGVRVDILFGPGTAPVHFELSEQEARQFWLRWGELKTTSNMVPLAADNGYHGLRLRAGDDREIRLYNGVAMRGDEARSDTFRTLERWVLAKAPPPLGPQLVEALDEAVATTSPERAALPRAPVFVGSLIRTCRERGAHDLRLRGRCLADALLENREPDVAVHALEEALKATDPKLSPAEIELQPDAP